LHAQTAGEAFVSQHNPPALPHCIQSTLQNINSWVAIADASSKSRTLRKLRLRACGISMPQGLPTLGRALGSCLLTSLDVEQCKLVRCSSAVHGQQQPPPHAKMIQVTTAGQAEVLCGQKHVTGAMHTGR
jgi:hypothetical protein